ncbi:hypothetical protein PGT21_015586 [Puccinia graminis f. sp. tritici]|uniref:Uncharacterized protein n=1 Tax=Puccinia graminis f. sp. tritici TaxID=56615 RepID=A0A5B0LMZ5_PUCGR|nr:hypothetical protein PGTUg99_020823 [Puccinia graminis f. sp. tritici]KAA1090848.1 hypothetical protein PGT21_015586 [Puccinia graminis f. sp. tritici]
MSSVPHQQSTTNRSVGQPLCFCLTSSTTQVQQPTTFDRFKRLNLACAVFSFINDKKKQTTLNLPKPTAISN